jgi:hypothetical protein
LSDDGFWKFSRVKSFYRSQRTPPPSARMRMVMMMMMMGVGFHIFFFYDAWKHEEGN